MNVIDLSDLMREHADHDPVPVLAASRIAGVERKVVAARRRIHAAWTATVLAVVAVIVVPLAVAGRHIATPATPAATATSINGFPEYVLGGHLVATQTGPLADPLSLRFTPTDLGFIIGGRCTVTDPDVAIEIQVSIGSHLTAALSCTATANRYTSADPAPSDRIVPGTPTDVTFTASAYRPNRDTNGDQTNGTPVPMPAGSYTVALWQKIPFTRYRLPPRPKTLPNLDGTEDQLSASGAVEVVASDPANPLAPRTITFTMPDCPAAATGCNPAAALSQTPGLLQIAVNGIPVTTASFFDYTGTAFGFHIGPQLPGLTLHPGEPVTVTITPEYVTGAWRFEVAPGVGP